MAALSLAGFGAGGGMMAGGKNLTCGVCREVYRSPRLLPCHHTFCLYCVEGLDKAHDRQPFPCPSCREPTALPRPDGALGLKVNFYITEEELQQAREGPGTTPCREHDGYPLVLYCEQCEAALCMVCKMTQHDIHPTKFLAEAAARCRHHLGELETRGPLEDAIRFMTERSALVNESVQGAQAEAERVKEQVRAQHERLVAQADRWRDATVAEVDTWNLEMKGQLSADAARVQRELDALLQLGQRVQRAMDDASDAETVEVEREMRRGRGNKETLQEVKDAVPHIAVKPSLNFDPASLVDDVICRLVGSPVKVSVPLGFKEVLVPVYQCGQDEEGACRQVHSLRPQGGGSIDISYGGTLPGYDGKRKIGLSSDGNLKVLTIDAVIDYNLSDKSGIFHLKPVINQVAKKMPLKWCVVSADSHSCFEPIICGNPIAFDIKKNRQVYVVVDETTTYQTAKPRNTERNVLLRRRNRTRVYRYTPPNADFHPTDACFWSEQGEVKLLVADSGNDSVHVVRLRRVAVSTAQGLHPLYSDFDEEICFERYLAPGDANLVRPTALNVDDDDRVWVGCANGWIMRCDKASENAEPRAGGGLKLGMDNKNLNRSCSVDSASVAALGMENGSRPSVDSASVAALRVENDSNSSVDSASVAALGMENGSRPSVDSASVAALRVENDSNSSVDSASVAALRVVNGSNSSVDSASVAALRVENGSSSSVDSAPLASLGVENGSNSSVDSASLAALGVENGSSSSVDSASLAALGRINGNHPVVGGCRLS